MKRKCVFCEGSNLSNEHIFAQWLIKELGVESSELSMIHTNFFGLPKSTRNIRYKNLIIGLVCERCNNGWMSKLEIECKPHIINLMNLKNVENELSWVIGNHFLIAKWAFKNIVLLNKASNYHDLVPESHFKKLYNGNIPKNVFINLSFCHKGSGLEWQQGQGLMFFYDKRVDIQKKRDKYTIIFRINQLLIKVSFLEAIERVVYEDSDCIQIYPYFASHPSKKGYLNSSVTEFYASGKFHVMLNV